MNKSKRIFIINSVYKIGSTGRICFDLASFFNNAGYKTTVCYGRNKQEEDGQSYYFSNKLSVYSHAFLSRIFDCDGRLSFFSTKKLIKFMNLNKEDIVVLNNIHGYYINIELLLNELRKKQCKVLFVLHDSWLFTGHCAYFQKKSATCIKWKTQCFRCPFKTNYPSSYIFDFSRQNYLFKKELFSSMKNISFIVPSEWMMNNFKESYLSNFDVKLINNGIDIDIFKKADIPNELSNRFFNKKIILCVSNIWNESKGIDDIYRLSELLDKNEHIIIIGKVKTKKYVENITYINHTNSPKELAEYYSLAKVFFNPTYMDNYPTVNLEALSCMCPVVVYNSGGAAEVVDNDFVVNTGDYKEAYKRIKLILNNDLDYPFKDPNVYSKHYMHNKYLDVINLIDKL